MASLIGWRGSRMAPGRGRPGAGRRVLVWRDGGGVELTGPCGADPWYLQLAEADHPVEVVDRTVTDVVGFFSFLSIATLWFGLR